MSDPNCENLIDLYLEDEILSHNTQSKTELHAHLSGNNPEFVPPSWRNRDSLENNPFDTVQKLADRLKDPFDVLETEACLKPLHVPKEPTKIKLGNLLSLSEDNLQTGTKKTSTPCLNAELGVVKLQDLESPSVAFNEKRSSDNISETETTPNSSAETSASAKLGNNMEHRKRLLKLSISNCAFSTPAAYKEFDGIFGTPASSIFSKTTDFDGSLLSAESPLKFAEDEVNSSEEPQNSIDLEKKFEADLEMLKIPILNDLPSPIIKGTSIKPDELDMVNIKHTVLKSTVPNLEAIKTKLKAKKSEISASNRLEISNLIENLKALISCGEIVNERKEQASNLLDSLTTALIPSNKEERTQNSEMLDVPPKLITRQDTFDLDIQEADTDRDQLLQEIPRCMVSSSDTYENEAPKRDLKLPQIAPLSTSRNPNNMQNDINNIVEQLSKLLINNSADNQTSLSNPTLIVVMNANQLNNSNIDDCKLQTPGTKARSGFVANYLENSITCSSLDLTKSNSLPRRRSQSLSIHDKMKVIHLPLQPPTSRSIEKQYIIKRDEMLPKKTTLPSNDKETTELKIPGRLRCNSFSSGTPCTAKVGLGKAGFSSDTNKFSQIRMAQTLNTHHESKQHAVVGPMAHNLPTFRPAFKKKIKSKEESIFKLSGPLKATIPVKKVAPMQKSSPLSSEKKLISKISSTPNTPIPARCSKLGVEVGYPNACSTPSAFSSPLKRTTGLDNNPRYSYMSNTPNPKSSLANSSAGSLKRRTLVESEAKSPLKTTMNNSGLQFSRVSTGTSRLSVSAGGRNSKTPIKAEINTATVKPSSRLSSRLSVSGSLISKRNKENKRL